MLSFVIPVYRSTHSLQELKDRIDCVFGFVSEGYEILFVDDSGGAESWSIIQDMCKSDTRVRGIHLNRNYGQHNALLCGIRRANGNIIITLDDDLQHLPEEIPKLLVKLNNGYDVVYGPPESEQHGVMRDLASKITKLALQGVMGKFNTNHITALRVFKTHLRNAFINYNSPTVNIDVLLTWATTRISSVKVKHDVRKFGKSGYTLGQLVRHSFNMMTGFSVLPLKLSSIIGFIFAAFGFIILVYVFINWLIKGSIVPGFYFLASLIAILSGAQLLSLGIIGEYLARIHMRTMERPPYIIQEEI
jgi:glycosyltransferase involved in cell wall biosynthesis